MASQTTTKKNNGQISHFFALVSKMDHIKKNKIEGTPILKLAMVKRSKIHQENCQENSSKKIRQKILQTHRQKIRQNVKKVCQNISSKKFLKKILQINSSKKFVK